MSRRQVGSTRRGGDSGSFPFVGALHSKSRSSPLLSTCLVLVGACLLIGYAFSGPGMFKSIREVSKITGDYTCTSEVQRAIPVLKIAYGDSMRKVLHVGPETCSVVSTLLNEEETEAWGVEPYDVEDADSNCKSLLRKGLVRVADIKFPLPYRSKSFSVVIVSDALDYLSPKYLNKTVPELARVASDGVVLFAGNPVYTCPVRELDAVLLCFLQAKMRSSSWWNRFFSQTSLEENEGGSKKFEKAASKLSYKPACQVFHLKPLH
ncbi:hypothetical protein Bca101_042308 [Brassica carinata]